MPVRWLQPRPPICVRPLLPAMLPGAQRNPRSRDRGSWFAPRLRAGGVPVHQLAVTVHDCWHNSRDPRCCVSPCSPQHARSRSERNHSARSLTSHSCSYYHVVMAAKPRTTTAIRFPEEMHKQLQKAAEERDLSINFLVVKAVEDFLPRLAPLRNFASPAWANLRRTPAPVTASRRCTRSAHTGCVQSPCTAPRSSDPRRTCSAGSRRTSP